MVDRYLLDGKNVENRWWRNIHNLSDLGLLAIINIHFGDGLIVGRIVIGAISLVVAIFFIISL